MKSRLIKYTRSQQVILVVLACFILSSIVIDIYIKNTHDQDNSFLPDSATLAMISNFENSLESIQMENKRSWNIELTPTSIPRERFQFDPNTIDSVDLIRLGFRPFMARNIINYRRHGGKLYSISKLKQIYGIDTLLVDSLSDLISFNSIRSNIKTYNSVSTHKYKPKSYFNFEINSADTSILRRLPMIGPGRASMIIYYRNSLGGFHSANQLYEIENLPDSVVDNLLHYVECNTDSIKKIAINHSSIKRLKSHPYISYYQAKAIYDLRWDKVHKGKITKEDMYVLKEFSKEELERLLPYLEF